MVPPSTGSHPTARPTGRGRTLAERAALVLLALLGVAALVVGIGLRTWWLPSDEVTATARLSAAAGGGADGAAPLVITAPGVLESRPGPVQVTATAEEGRPVVLAVGREVDVRAWTAGVPTATVTGLRTPTALAVEPPAATTAPAEVPDPATSDLWTQRSTGTTSASLTYDPPEGRYLLLAATDGSAPAPARLQLTWPQDQATPAAVPLMAGGAAALLLALVLLAVHRRAVRRRAAAPGRRPAEEASR